VLNNISSTSITIPSDENLSSPSPIDKATQKGGILPRGIGDLSASTNPEKCDIMVAGGDYFSGTSHSDIRIKRDDGTQPVTGCVDSDRYWVSRPQGFQQSKNCSDEAFDIVQTKKLANAEDDGAVPMSVRANEIASSSNCVIDNDINLIDVAQQSFGFIDDDIAVSSRNEHRLEAANNPSPVGEGTQKSPYSESSGALKTKRAIKSPSKVKFLGCVERDGDNNCTTIVFHLHSTMDSGAAGAKKCSPLKIPIISSSRSGSSFKGSTPVTPSRLTRGCGTPLCMAPEVSEKGVNYEAKIDVYSFGLLM